MHRCKKPVGERQQTPKPDQGVAFLKSGSWSIEERSQNLWWRILNPSPSPPGPVSPVTRILASGTLFDLPATPDHLSRWAALGWTNGVVAGFSGGSEVALKALPPPRVDAEALSIALDWEVRHSDLELEPIARVRDSIARLRGRPVYSECDWNPESILVDFAHAGFSAVRADSLFAGIVAASLDELPSGSRFLGQLLVEDSRGLGTLSLGDPLIRFFAFTYDQTPAERQAISSALHMSLQTVRSFPSTPVDLLINAFIVGRRLVFEVPDVMSLLLEELGPEGWKRVIEIFHKFLPSSPEETHPADIITGIQQWIPKTHQDLLSDPHDPSALLVLRHAYDFAFWAGIVREGPRRAPGHLSRRSRS